MFCFLAYQTVSLSDRIGVVTIQAWIEKYDCVTLTSCGQELKVRFSLCFSIIDVCLKQRCLGMKSGVWRRCHLAWSAKLFEARLFYLWISENFSWKLFTNQVGFSSRLFPFCFSLTFYFFPENYLSWHF